MVASIPEELLLQQAVAAGLLPAEAVAAASQADSGSPPLVKWGRVIDRLIATEKLTDSTDQRLAEALCLAKREAAAMARSIDGGSVDAVGAGVWRAPTAGIALPASPLGQ